MHPLLISYLYYFNIERDYFECHEYGEVLWLESGRPQVLKGLIQSAVCLYHLHNGNCKGATSMWQRARRYLGPSRPVYEDINLDKLIFDIDDVFSRVPSEWSSLILPPAKISELSLPTVLIEIHNEDVVARLPNWIPEPLEH